MRTEEVLHQVQSGVCDAELHPELIGLKAGQKRHWIRDHYKEFLRYHSTYGPYRTMQRFGIRRRSTIDGMLEANQLPKLEQSERALLNSEIAMEASRETTARVSDLEARIDDIEPMAKVGYAILEAMRKALPGVELPDKISRPDKLRLEKASGNVQTVMSSVDDDGDNT